MYKRFLKLLIVLLILLFTFSMITYAEEINIISPENDSSYYNYERPVFSVKVGNVEENNSTIYLEYYNGLDWQVLALKNNIEKDYIVDLIIDESFYNSLQKNKDLEFRYRINNYYYSEIIRIQKKDAAAHLKIYTPSVNVGKPIFYEDDVSDGMLEFTADNYLPEGTHTIIFELTLKTPAGDQTQIYTRNIKVEGGVSYDVTDDIKTFHINFSKNKKSDGYYNRLNSLLTEQIYYLNILEDFKQENEIHIQNIDGIKDMTGKNDYTGNNIYIKDDFNIQKTANWMDSSMLADDSVMISPVGSFVNLDAIFQDAEKDYTPYNILGYGSEIGIFEKGENTSTDIIDIFHPGTGQNVKALKLKANTSIPYAATKAMNLKTGVNYIIEFDYWSDVNGKEFKADFIENDLPQNILLANKIVGHSKWIINSNSSNIKNAKLRFINDIAIPNQSNIYITNIQVYEEDFKEANIKHRGQNRAYRITHTAGEFEGITEFIPENNQLIPELKFDTLDSTEVITDGDIKSVQINKPGKYRFEIFEEDKIQNLVGKDFSKKSNTSFVEMYFHNYPEAKISVIENGDGTLKLISESFDVDFISQPNKGIQNEKWEYRQLDKNGNIALDWSPIYDINRFHVNPLVNTYIKLTVTDMGAFIGSTGDGELTNTSIITIDSSGKPPIADFNIKVGLDLSSSIASNGIIYNGNIGHETVQLDPSISVWNDLLATEGSRNINWSINQAQFNNLVNTQTNIETTLTINNKYGLSDSISKNANVKTIGVNNNSVDNIIAGTDITFDIQISSPQNLVSCNDLVIKFQCDDLGLNDILMNDMGGNRFTLYADFPNSIGGVVPYVVKIFSKRTGELLTRVDYNLNIETFITITARYDSGFPYTSIPASEDFHLLDIITESPIDILNLKMSIYEGNIIKTPIKTLYHPDNVEAKSGKIWNWADIINYNIPEILPDKSYLIKIIATAENGTIAEWTNNLTVNTPINLIPDMPSTVIAGQDCIIKATTEKYAHEVSIVIFDGTSYATAPINMYGSFNGSWDEWVRNYLVPNSIPEGLYTVRYKAITPNGNEEIKFANFNLIKNRPPTVTITKLLPSIIYENDTVYAYIQPYAPDIEMLNMKIRLLRNGSEIWTTSTNVWPNGSNYDQVVQKIRDSIELGNYRLEVSVSDSYGETATDYKNFSVNELGITGFVNHTPTWNENRKKYNISKTDNSENPRGYNIFFPGEKFVLQANTTIINPGHEDNLRALRVTAKINGTAYSTLLNNTSNNIWEGLLWNQAMLLWKDQTLSFIFTVEYSNGAIKNHTVNVLINDDPYWRQHLLE